MKNWAWYISGEERRLHSRVSLRDQRLTRLEAAVEPIKERLIELGASRIWLFGSVARGLVHSKSDLDMAVEGLSLTQDELLLIAEEETSLPVDLVPIERCSKLLRERILREGILLHDA